MMMRKAAAVAASVLAAATLSASPAEAATGVLDGAFSWPGYVGYQFGGALCPCEVVPGYLNWPSQQNITQGAVAIDQWLARNAAAPTTTVILGTSEGAQAAYRYGRWHPQSTQQFITTGNPERKYGGIFAPLGEGVPPGGIYTDVAIQYDFFADFPNNPDSPYYFLAVINVVAGGFWTHIVGYNSVNLYDPNNRVWTEGNITYVLIPDRPHLWGVSQQQIEDAYIRPTGPVIYGTAPTQEGITHKESTVLDAQSVSGGADQNVVRETVPQEYQSARVDGLSSGADAGLTEELRRNDPADATESTVSMGRRNKRMADSAKAEPADSTGGDPAVRRSAGSPGADQTRRNSGVARSDTEATATGEVRGNRSQSQRADANIRVSKSNSKGDKGDDDADE
jgi:hypothetical protein